MTNIINVKKLALLLIRPTPVAALSCAGNTHIPSHDGTINRVKLNMPTEQKADLYSQLLHRTDDQTVSVITAIFIHQNKSCGPLENSAEYFILSETHSS